MKRAQGLTEDIAPHATLGENSALLSMERRLATLDRWIEERSEMKAEYEALVKKIRERAQA